MPALLTFSIKERFHVEEPPPGIQIVHEADLVQPSKLEYPHLEEYFLYKKFQIQDLLRHVFLVKRSHMHVNFKLNLQLLMHSSITLLLEQIT